MQEEKKLFYTKLNNLRDLVKTVIYSNPESRMHILYKYQDIVYIYYSNAREVLWTRSNKIETGIFEWRENTLYQLPASFDLKDAMPMQTFVFIVEVKGSDLLNAIQ